MSECRGELHADGFEPGAVIGLLVDMKEVEKGFRK
jgi:hypothetical protein